MQLKSYYLAPALLILIIGSLLMIYSADEVNAIPNTEKHALIIVSTYGQTPSSEIDKAVSFYEYLIDEEYNHTNIHFYGPTNISYVDANSSVENVEAGFQCLIDNSSIDQYFVIYISDHVTFSESIYNFEDGNISSDEVSDYLDNMTCDQLTFINNGNHSGICEDYRAQSRIIMSSMASDQSYSPDYFNITRSLEDIDADTNNNQVVSYQEAFNHEVYLIEQDGYDQDPKIWIN